MRGKIAKQMRRLAKDKDGTIDKWFKRKMKVTWVGMSVKDKSDKANDKTRKREEGT